MFRALTSLALFLGANLLALSAFAQSPNTEVTQETAVNSIAASPSSKGADYCINIMASFPTEDHEIRYQFFRLTEEVGRDITPNFRQALDKYGDKRVAQNNSMLEAIEEIANPVLRQAAPEITIANMVHVIDFASICEPVITGQINSLKAYDTALEDVAFNAVIIEDALFLRQILSDSLFRVGANEDPLYRDSISQYANALVKTRDEAEFTSFEAELGDLETLYMNDLDGRLKRSNDIINEEMDRETLGDAVALSDSLNEAERRKAKERQIFSLIRILGGGG